MKRFSLFLICIASAIAEPPGIEQSMEFVSPPDGGMFLRWYGKQGRSYFMQVSDPTNHLNKWKWAPIIERGNDEEISYDIDGTADKGFFRLKYADQVPGANETLDTADYDNDGLTNIDEVSPPQAAMAMRGVIPPLVTNATDPLNPDTDGDGLPDGWENAHGLNGNDSVDAGNLFPGSTQTNQQAFNSGVQANANATPSNKDGDALNDSDDADPQEILVDWKKSTATSYLLIDVNMPSGFQPAPLDLNDKGDVLTNSGVWSGGIWSFIQEPASQTIGDFTFHFGGMQAMNNDGVMVGYSIITLEGSDSEKNTTYSLAPGNEPHIHSNAILPIKHYENNTMLFPLGIDNSGRSFVALHEEPRDEWGVYHTNIRIAVINAQGNSAVILAPANGNNTLLHNLQNQHSELSAAGYFVTNTVSKVNSGGGTGTTRRVAMWNPQLEEMTLPAEADGWYHPLHLGDLPNDKPVLAGTKAGDGGGSVFLPPVSGGGIATATRQILGGISSSASQMLRVPSLSRKNIVLFAGDGTAITKDHKIWRNGELTPARALCPRYGELLDDEYLIYPLKANKHGGYLMGAEAPTGGTETKLMLPAQVVSRDKFLAGSFRIPESFANLEIEFSGHEDLGRYGNLMGGGTTKVFDSVEQILNTPDGAEDEQPENQKVWFVRDSADPRKIFFYTCYSTIGEAEIRIHLNNGSSTEPGRIPHTLTEAADFASTIAYVDRWVKGASFTGTWANTTWLAMNTTALEGEIANQARACLIPFFDIIDQVTGFTPLVMGLCDGVRMGFNDDKAFLTLLFNGAVQSENWIYNNAKAELDRWTTNPLARENELKKILYDLCKNVVLPHLSELGETFTTWDGFRNHAWNMWHKVKQANEMLRVVPMATVHLLNDALIEWSNDFASRMMTGAEKAAWDNVAWDFSPMLSAVEANRNMAFYTFGYTFGYIGEQCVTAVLSAGTVTVGKICAKNGINMISKIAPRAVAVLAMRFHYIKQALTDLNLMDSEVRLAYEGMMSAAAREPTTPLIKEIPASRMESRMANTAFTRTTFNFQEFIKTALKDGNVRKLIKSPGGRDIFSKRTSQLMHLLGDECDAITMKNFMKAAEDRVVVVHPDGTVDEFFEGFFRAFEGNSSLLAHLDDPLHSRAGYSDGAKARLKFFLSDPNAGDLWKLDDYAPGDSESWKRYITRGVLGELDIYKRIYKPQGYGHSPTAPGFDFTGSKWVQVKTCKSPGTTQNIADMKTAITDLVTAAGESSAPLKLHILKKPGTDSAALETALDDYLLDKTYKNRFEFQIDSYNIGPQ